MSHETSIARPTTVADYNLVPGTDESDEKACYYHFEHQTRRFHFRAARNSSKTRQSVVE